MEHQYKKYFLEDKKARKEAAILRHMGDSDIRDLVPCVKKVKHQRDTTIIAMSTLPGLPLTATMLTPELVISLGKIAKYIHSFGKYNIFGSLDDELHIQQPALNFSEFLRKRILKWQDRFDYDDAYVQEYTGWLMQKFTRMESLLNECRPVFCHGDFDLKNILSQHSAVTGLIDWEHAGIFCIEWELRKLSRYCNEQNNFLENFFAGYRESLPLDLKFKKQIIRYVEAADALGHLGWCKRHNNMVEYAETVTRMNNFLHSDI